MQKAFAAGPFLTVSLKPDEDPVGWEIMTKAFHREIVEGIYSQFPNNPDLAKAVLTRNAQHIKDEVLAREETNSARLYEAELARLESEGGRCAE